MRKLLNFKYYINNPTNTSFEAITHKWDRFVCRLTCMLFLQMSLFAWCTIWLSDATWGWTSDAHRIKYSHCNVAEMFLFLNTRSETLPRRWWPWWSLWWYFSSDSNPGQCLRSSKNPRTINSVKRWTWVSTHSMSIYIRCMAYVCIFKYKCILKNYIVDSSRYLQKIIFIIAFYFLFI